MPLSRPDACLAEPTDNRYSTRPQTLPYRAPVEPFLRYGVEPVKASGEERRGHVLPVVGALADGRFAVPVMGA